MFEPAPAGAFPARRGGRRRDPSRDVAIRDAVVRLLGDIGYGPLTMDAVAAEAGVGKATIYRRWRSKEDLVVDTIVDINRTLVAPVDTGSVEEDVRVVVGQLVTLVNGPVGTAIRAVLPVLPHQPRLAEVFSAGPLAAWEGMYRALWERAESRGEIPPHVAGPISSEAISALFVQRWLLTGQPVTPEYAEDVLRIVVYPLVRALADESSAG